MPVKPISRPLLVGTADVSIFDIRVEARATGAQCVLLLPEFTAYKANREARDLMQPSKANQNGDYYYGVFRDMQSQFDYVATDLPSAEALRQRFEASRLILLFGPPGAGKTTLADLDLERSPGPFRTPILRALMRGVSAL